MTKEEKAKEYMTKRFLRKPHHEDIIISCMIEFADHQLEQKESHYQGCYNGLKFKFDEQVKNNKELQSVITTQADRINKLVKEVEKWKQDHKDLLDIHLKNS